MLRGQEDMVVEATRTLDKRGEVSVLAKVLTELGLISNLSMESSTKSSASNSWHHIKEYVKASLRFWWRDYVFMRAAQIKRPKLTISLYAHTATQI